MEGKEQGKDIRHVEGVARLVEGEEHVLLFTTDLPNRNLITIATFNSQGFSTGQTGT